MRIFHIAAASDWAAARRSGEYRTSTRGRSLEDEGFLHAARRQQVPAVFRRYYRDVDEPLVLLTIDTERLGVPWREERVGDESFPHIYGPLFTSAVVGVEALDEHGGTGSFTSMFVAEMLFRIILAMLAMLLAGAGARLGATVLPEWGAFLGALAGLAVGGTMAVVVVRRRRW